MNVIRTNLEEDQKVELYKMTKGKESRSMKDCVGETIHVAYYVEYEDENAKGDIVHLLSVMDEGGVARTTNSATFRREFLAIVDMGLLHEPIKVIGGTTKAGKEFIDCTL